MATQSSKRLQALSLLAASNLGSLLTRSSRSYRPFFDPVRRLHTGFDTQTLAQTIHETSQGLSVAFSAAEDLELQPCNGRGIYARPQGDWPLQYRGSSTGR